MYLPHCNYPLYCNYPLHADLVPQEKIDGKDLKYYLLIGAVYIAVFLCFLFF